MQRPARSIASVLRRTTGSAADWAPLAISRSTRARSETPFFGTGGDLPLIPDYQAQIGLTYVSPLRFKVTVAQSFVGERVGNPLDYRLEPYTTTDAAIGWKSESGNFEFDFKFLDIFDTDFEFVNYIPGPGRTIAATTRARFLMQPDFETVNATGLSRRQSASRWRGIGLLVVAHRRGAPDGGADVAMETDRSPRLRLSLDAVAAASPATAPSSSRSTSRPSPISSCNGPGRAACMRSCSRRCARPAPGDRPRYRLRRTLPAGGRRGARRGPGPRCMLAGDETLIKTPQAVRHALEPLPIHRRGAKAGIASIVLESDGTLRRVPRYADGFAAVLAAVGRRTHADCRRAADPLRPAAELSDRLLLPGARPGRILPPDFFRDRSSSSA